MSTGISTVMSNNEAYASRLHALEAGLQTLPDKPEETAETAFAALYHLAAGQALSAQAITGLPLPELNAAQLGKLDALIARRIQGTPLAHLTGRQAFMGLEMLAGPQALIPRQETELLAKAAINQLKQMAASLNRPLLVVDVCTGSGNLALAMAHAYPSATVWASDLSAQAVELAQANARHLNFADRVQCRVGDLLAPFEDEAFLGQVDLLLCNPPYISSGKLDTMPAEIIQHEPTLAFDGGPFGIRILQKLMREAPRFVRPGGWLGFEVGLGQGPAVGQWLARTGQFGPPLEIEDQHGQVRSLMAQRLTSQAETT